MNRLWLLPGILTLNIILVFASFSIELLPKPDDLIVPIPYLALGNLLLILYISLRQRDQLTKALMMSAPNLGLAYLWFIQTA